MCNYNKMVVFIFTHCFVFELCESGKAKCALVMFIAMANILLSLVIISLFFMNNNSFSLQKLKEKRAKKKKSRKRKKKQKNL